MRSMLLISSICTFSEQPECSRGQSSLFPIDPFLLEQVFVAFLQTVVALQLLAVAASAVFQHRSDHPHHYYHYYYYYYYHPHRHSLCMADGEQLQVMADRERLLVMAEQAVFGSALVAIQENCPEAFSAVAWVLFSFWDL